KDILVVGEGDSAAEVALALAEQNRVTMFSRKMNFPRMNPLLRSAVSEKFTRGQLAVCLNAELARIEREGATLLIGGFPVPVKAQHVFVKIGAEMPRGFLERCGITFASKDVDALPILDAHYQSSIPGLYIIGSLSGKNLIKHALNQGYEVIEHIAGHAVEAAEEPELSKRLQYLPGSSVAEK